MRERAIGLAVVLLLLLSPSAHAEEVGGAELRRRAAVAAARPHDATALDAVRRVDRVDGRPVDLDRALDGAEGDELVTRLRTLAGGDGSPTVDEASARDDARAILDGRRFRPVEAPRPLRGVLRWLGDRLRPIGEPIGRFFDAVAEERGLQVVVGLAIVLAASAIALTTVRRRNAAAVLRGEERRRGGRAQDPAALERAADEAERSGDLDLAVRLRFRAGLVRLDRGGVVVLRPSLTSGELVRRVPSPTLRHLAHTFEAVAYGGRHASADEADAARHGWARVLDEALR